MLLTRSMVLGETSQQAESPPDYLIPVREGVGGIADTLATMVAWTKQFRQNLTIRNLAEQIIAAVPAKNYWSEVEAIQNWVRDNIRYTQDVYNVETMKTPLALLESRMGDCDDMATLTGSLLQSVGHPVRYVAVGQGGAEDYSHVYLETKIGARWVGVETTEPMPLGWVPEQQYPRMVRNV